MMLSAHDDPDTAADLGLSALAAEIERFDQSAPQEAMKYPPEHTTNQGTDQ